MGTPIQLEIPFPDDDGDYDQGDDYDYYDPDIDWDAALDNYFDFEGFHEPELEDTE